MEVLGTASSIVALLEISIRTTKAINHLVSSWKGAPLDIIALSNEVNDSKAVLHQVCHLIRKFNHIPTNHDGHHTQRLRQEIEQQINQAFQVWKYLQEILNRFKVRGDEATGSEMPSRLKWLRCREKINQTKQRLREKRMILMELLVSSSAHQGHVLDMRLVGLSTEITHNTRTSSEMSDSMQEKMKDIKHSISRLENSQAQGFQELFDLFFSYHSARPDPEKTVTFTSKTSTDILLSNAEAERYNQERKKKEVEDAEYSMQPELIPSDPIGVSNAYTALIHLTFHQRTNFCDESCECVCHSCDGRWKFKSSNSARFKAIFGSLFVGYSCIPKPNTSCDVATCEGVVSGSTAVAQYTFPSWFANRAIVSVISTRAAIPEFWMRITRRMPYVPGNIFSRINSKDFNGAIKLLHDGVAHVNDVEARHGNSILATVLRRPVPTLGLIRFIEFLLQRGIDPYIPNDEGESAWHFAARLMLPSASNNNWSSKLQYQLKRLFPDPDWDIFQFTHLHKVVAGFRPVDLKKVLENPTYRSQVNSGDALGLTPLELAAMLGDHNAVEALIHAGADVNPSIHSTSSFHPLRKAVKSQSTRCVEILLMAKKTNSLILDTRGATLIHTAAAGSNTLPLIHPLHLSGIALDSQNKHGCTPLSFTTLHDNQEVAKFLLLQGSKVNNVDKDGDSPLTEAIRLNAHGCLRLFLDNGANIQHINHRGWNLLHIAAAFGDEETMEILTLAHLQGLDPDLPDSSGQSPRGCLAGRQDVPNNVLSAFEYLMRSLVAEEDTAGRQYIVGSSGNEKNYFFASKGDVSCILVRVLLRVTLCIGVSMFFIIMLTLGSGWTW